MTPPRARCPPVIAIRAVIGAIVLAATFACTREHGAPRQLPPAMPPEDYGRDLLTRTSVLIGPDEPDPSMRYAGNRLQCASCHRNAGADPGALALVDTYGRYPRPSGRDGGVRDIKARINGCMMRSMNGRALPLDGPEMNAMASYLHALGDPHSAGRASQTVPDNPGAFVTPARAASPAAGRRVFDARCAVCHGADGHGLRAGGVAGAVYLFPPLWGPDSFNDGAGMHRVLTSAKFMKARMPYGKADLTDGEAFDVAAFMNVQPRPAMANLDRDYPDRTTKPVDNPYGPYADPFPPEQHRLGPFPPIDAFYARLKSSK